MLGHPGAVLVDGEVVGAWRTKASGQKLTVTVEPFEPIAPARRREAEVEAERIAACRDLALDAVAWG